MSGQDCDIGCLIFNLFWKITVNDHRQCSIFAIGALKQFAIHSNVYPKIIFRHVDIMRSNHQMHLKKSKSLKVDEFKQLLSCINWLSLASINKEEQSCMKNDSYGITTTLAIASIIWINSFFSLSQFFQDFGTQF